MERPTVRIQNSTSPDRTKCYFLSIIINKLGSKIYLSIRYGPVKYLDPDS